MTVLEQNYEQIKNKLREHDAVWLRKEHVGDYMYEYFATRKRVYLIIMNLESEYLEVFAPIDIENSMENLMKQIDTLES